MRLGLRIDVDTFRGTNLGVPSLCALLARHGVRASFFFSVGPDNMGRHVRRLLRPSFLWKMLRTRASSLYGWDILLRGTFWPGPVIGRKLGHVIRAASDAGHEIGLHAWDHHAWQMGIDSMDAESIYRTLRRGCDLLTDIIGRSPCCSAAPAWKCPAAALLAKSRLPFTYNSDCRGRCVFLPIVDGKSLSQPQVPTTLATYDEVIGQGGVCDENYNDHVLSQLAPDRLNVLTIHAEVEGVARRELFDAFLQQASATGVRCVPLGDLTVQTPNPPRAPIVVGSVPGREGWISCQGDTRRVSSATFAPEGVAP